MRPTFRSQDFKNDLSFLVRGTSSTVRKRTVPRKYSTEGRFLFPNRGRRGLLRKRAKAFYILSPELWLQAIECFCAPRKGLTFPFGEGGLSADDLKHKKESFGNLRRWWMRFLSPKKTLAINRKCLFVLFHFAICNCIIQQKIYQLVS